MLNVTQIDASQHRGFDHHEQVVRFEDPDYGLLAYIAVHNTNCGPSLGGCRVYPYKTEDDAITDVLRLSRGMTYKSALARLPLGGGKAVIIGDPRLIKRAGFMARFGEAVNQLSGAYITAEDVGSNESDMIEISRTTSYVAGLPPQENDQQDHVSGNPSPVTAYGVYCGIKSCLKTQYQSDSILDKTIAIQGMGAVGYALAQYLAAEGARLIVADMNEETLARAEAEFAGRIVRVDPSEIHMQDADIFAPCALGAGLNDRTIPEIKAKIIAGAANNQLAEARHDQMLRARDILYAPDYAINSGGITSVGYEYFSRSGNNPYSYPLTPQKMMEHVARISETLNHIFILAQNKAIGYGEAADSLAEEIFMAGASSQITAA